MTTLIIHKFFKLNVQPVGNWDDIHIKDVVFGDSNESHIDEEKVKLLKIIIS